MPEQPLPRGAENLDDLTELREAHDVLAPFYAEKLRTMLDEMPVERAVLGLFCEWVVSSGGSAVVGDLGCGTGRLAPFLRQRGCSVRGVDLSPEMIRFAAAEQPDARYEVGDIRALPYGEAELDGALCWYSFMYLHAGDRRRAFRELSRVVRPGGYVAAAFKVGDDNVRRGGRGLGLGVGFDIYWHSHEEWRERLGEAGFEEVFWAGRPADADEPQPQGYLLARRHS